MTYTLLYIEQKIYYKNIIDVKIEMNLKIRKKKERKKIGEKKKKTRHNK